MERDKTAKLMMYLAGAVVVGFFLVVSVLVFVEIPEKNVSAINQFFGALISTFTGVLGYFFGSSKGSADKTELLKPSQPAAVPEAKP